MSKRTETHLDMLPERPDGFCENMANCKLALCGCRWLQTGSPWVDDEQQQSEEKS